MSFDPKCFDLATHFLGESAPEASRNELAQMFQDAAEGLPLKNRKSVLSNERDAMGFFYGYLPDDSRRIDVRFEHVDGRITEPMRFFVYVGGEKLRFCYLSKEGAERGAINWMRENPED